MDAIAKPEANKAMIVFQAPLVHRLSTPQERLEPTYVGVRRVRPSSRLVKDVLRNEKKRENEEEESENKRVSFTVVGEDGVERRMTKQEKKAEKFRMAQEKKLLKEQRRLEKEQNEPPPKKKKKRKRNYNKEEYEEAKPEKIPAEQVTQNAKPAENASEEEEDALDTTALAQVGVSQPKMLTPMEQELADLRGERQGVPPVILPPALAQCALQTLQPADASIWIDDDLAQDWCQILEESMEPALEVRGREDMRSLAYNIVPEVWKRLRPDTIKAGLFKPKGTPTQDDLRQSEEATQKSIGNGEWAWVSLRAPSSPSTFDSYLAIVTQVLHRSPSLYLSCGAKFGCDLLVYDGPRCERHAFAGLRLMNTIFNPSDDQQNSFPVPSPYGMAGYVRCLNTAGKLALIALVKREEESDGTVKCRVAFVDLKLERADGTKRKDISERLEKLHRS